MLFEISTCLNLLHNPRSPLTRSTSFVAIVLICLCSIVYLTYYLPGASARSNLNGVGLASLTDTGAGGRVRFQWTGGPKRLVVFGDSWSDNGQYAADTPSEDHLAARDAARGQVWTEWLCTAISCAHHDNFAQPSTSSSSPTELRGSVIDNSLLNSTWMAQQRVNHTSMIQASDVEGPAADLRAQVQQWVAFEKSQYGKDRSKGATKEGTVFTISFSMWEIWYFSGGVYANAQVLVTKSLDTLFEQLDLIAENWTALPKIVLLNAVDITFLPGWRAVRTGPYGLDPSAEDQRNAVLLTEQWNLALQKRASRWYKGQIYIHNTNDWFLDQIRDSQLQHDTPGDPNGLPSVPTPWRNVTSGCLGADDYSADVTQGDGSASRCSDPNTYLFWDRFHLGPTAMKMVGERVAADITDNHGVGTTENGRENP